MTNALEARAAEVPGHGAPQAQHDAAVAAAARAAEGLSTLTLARGVRRVCRTASADLGECLAMTLALDALSRRLRRDRGEILARLA